MSELIVDLFRFSHFLGLAALLGGLLVQLASSLKEVNQPILYGALAQLVTGIVLLLITGRAISSRKPTTPYESRMQDRYGAVHERNNCTLRQLGLRST